MRAYLALALAFGLALAACGRTRPASPENTPMYENAISKNIAYAGGPQAHPRRVLDVYAPDAAGPFPVLLFVSGGGWSSGSKDWVANLGRSLAPHGVVVVIPDHRLLPAVSIADQALDLAMALAWTQENIDAYGGHPEGIFVGGHSAGGHLTSLMVLDPDYLQQAGASAAHTRGVISISAPLDIGDSFEEDGLSPMEHLRPGLPPFLLLYAQRDFADLARQAASAQSALEQAGASTEVIEIAGRDHFSILGQFGQPGDPAHAQLLAWMQAVLDN